MENWQLTFNSETRRRKLDDIFGDDPYLSPTMKARRLHEKLELPETVSIEEISEESLDSNPETIVVSNPEAHTPDSPSDGSDVSSPLQIVCFDDQATVVLPQNESLISLTEAAALLRSGQGSGADSSALSMPLLQLRKQVLIPWLNDVSAGDSDLMRRSAILRKIK
jgi:hypothetical protein